MMKRILLIASALAGGYMASTQTAAADELGLDPRGKAHIAIGVPNTVDTLKTIVEAEGGFSPGFATYGVCFWLYDRDASRLYAPTQNGARVEHGLAPGGYLMPWALWSAGAVEARTAVCSVRRHSPAGEVIVDGARVTLTNTGPSESHVTLFAVLRPLGPAGGPVHRTEVANGGDALLADGRSALVADRKAQAAGALPTDTVGAFAARGRAPASGSAESPAGDCSGALAFDLALKPGAAQSVGFVCPVLPGRRAVGHHWDGTSEWAQLDLAAPNPATGGVLQPDPGLAYYRGLRADTLFEQATAYWRAFAGRARIDLPDARWAECFAAITGHVAMAMNEGAPDVTVINYNVFNRDGVYVTNILQKAGEPDLADEAIDYFLAHPFNGRVHPEADNPGQVLWIVGEHWRFTRDRAWLRRVYPAVRRLAAMIRYYRTAPGPHWVNPASLEFGDALPADQRQRLEPGSCDGFHPEYTEAFDVAGLRAAALLADAHGAEQDGKAWTELADRLFAEYDRRFGGHLPQEYGSYAVLWPCRLYPLDAGSGHDSFRTVGEQRPTGWRYFPLATAHQGLLAGNREAGYATIEAHLAHEQMRGWYAFDEGGASGPGGWRFARTTWDPGVAMPHGWAIAEMHLLLRDCLVFEDGDRAVLFAGLPPAWFTGPHGMSVADLPTYFGKLTARWRRTADGAELVLAGAHPPGGWVLRLPAGLCAAATADGKPVATEPNGDVRLPAGARRVAVRFTAARAGAHSGDHADR